MNSSQITTDHPATDNPLIPLPDFLLMPLVEAAFNVVKKNEESDIPTSLRRISHFDSKALNNSTARTQIIQSLKNNPSFCSLVEEEFFDRVEVSIAYREWSPTRAKEIIQEAQARNDLPLLASVLWIKQPTQFEFALGQIVAISSIAMTENEQRDSQRAEKSRVSHLENTLEREKSRVELLTADVERLEKELREERQSRRVKEQRSQAQLAAIQKQIDQHDELVERLKDSKERVNQRLEREASRAHELESRLRISQENAKTKSNKVSQLQEQLASALSSDLELNYEDLQNLIVAQQNAETISKTILNIMNKTRNILSQTPSSTEVQRGGTFEALRVSDEVDQAQSNAVTEIKEEASESAAKKSLQKRTQVIVPPGMNLESDAALRTVFTQPNLVVLIDGYNVSLNSFGDLNLELQRERTIVCATNI